MRQENKLLQSRPPLLRGEQRGENPGKVPKSEGGGGVARGLGGFGEERAGDRMPLEVKVEERRAVLLD